MTGDEIGASVLVKFDIFFLVSYAVNHKTKLTFGLPGERCTKYKILNEIQNINFWTRVDLSWNHPEARSSPWSFESHLLRTKPIGSIPRCNKCLFSCTSCCHLGTGFTLCVVQAYVLPATAYVKFRSWALVAGSEMRL